LEVDARSTLLDVLREHLGMTGTKKGCDMGHCGGCMVHVNGKRQNSCLPLAADLNEQSVTTIEGLSNGDTLHPMQEAFVNHDSMQCGYCTPGQIMSAITCIREGHAGSRAEIQNYMSENICRCGSYQNIVDAILEVKQSGKQFNFLTLIVMIHQEINNFKEEEGVRADAVEKLQAEQSIRPSMIYPIWLMLFLSPALLPRELSNNWMSPLPCNHQEYWISSLLKIVRTFRDTEVLLQMEKTIRNNGGA